jgi:hypothetical protein
VPRDAVQRWRLVVARAAIGAEAGQREQLAAWEATLVASGLPVAGLDASKPKPRFAPAAPLSGSIPGDAELVDVWLVARLPRWRVREALAPLMPPGHRLVDVYDVWLGEPALPGRVVASVYRVSLDEEDINLADVRAAATALLDAATLPRERSKGEAVVAYDLRPFIDGVEVVETGDGPIVRLVLRHDPEKGIGRPEELLAALAEAMGTQLRVTSIVRESLVLGTPPPPSPQTPRRTGLRPGPRGGAPAGR